MSKITRQTQLIFASTPGFDQMTQFGSTAQGGTVYTNSIPTIQANSAFLVGWYNAVEGGSYPIIQDMNAIHYLYAYQLAYLMQAGIPEWDSGTTYYVGSRASDSNGNVYLSIANSNLNNALTDSAHWLPPGSSPSNTLSTNLTIPSGYNYNASFLTISSSTTVTIAGTSILSALTIVNGTLIITGTVHTN